MYNIFHKYPFDKFDVADGDMIEYSEGLFMWVRESDINALGYMGTKLGGVTIINILPRLAEARDVREEKNRLIDRMLDYFIDEKDPVRKTLYHEMIHYAVKHYLK